MPDFYELVLVTSESKLAEEPDLIQRLVRAIVRGYQDAMANPQAAVDTLLVGTEEEVDEAIERPGVDVLAPLWGDGVPSFGWQTRERWEGFAAWMYDTGQLSQPVDPDAAFTNRFVEAAR